VATATWLVTVIEHTDSRATPSATTATWLVTVIGHTGSRATPNATTATWLVTVIGHTGSRNTLLQVVSRRTAGTSGRGLAQVDAVVFNGAYGT
jgi:hypothetical protein